MNICVIPARGGSKRIPRKNIKKFAGKPIIEWSISAAVESKCFDRILVSTDDEEIASISESIGAEVPFCRPDDLSEDFTPTADVVKHAIEFFQFPDISQVNVCCLYATAPFITPDDIRESLLILNSSICDFVLAVTSYPFPIQRALEIDQFNESLIMREPGKFSSRSQDLDKSYHDAGQFCWGKAEAWVITNDLFQNITLPYNLPRFRVQDIDTTEDWHRAELIHKAFYE